MKIRVAHAVMAAILLTAVEPAFAHRLDEYLQGAIIAVEKSRVNVEMTLTPGVAVFPVLIAEIDTNGDGVISTVEQRAYVGRVLRDVSLRIDGRALTPRLVSVEFPSTEEMKRGLGAIRLDFDAVLPRGGLNRKLVFENHHLSRIAAYQVNCLKPSDPDIRIVAQNRNYTQSFYELEYMQPGIRADLLNVVWSSTVRKLLRTIALLLGVALAVALLWRRRPSFVAVREPSRQS
jgi:hypothetical protein